MPEFLHENGKGQIESLPAPAEGANPDTCLHMLAQLCITKEFDLFVVCLSCASTLDDEFKNDYHWEYDVSFGLWQRHARDCRCNV